MKKNSKSKIASVKKKTAARKKAPKKNGRPSKYSDSNANYICERIATSSDGLHVICKELKVSAVAVYRWIKDNPDFRNRYARAREEQAELLASQMIEISDRKGKDSLTKVSRDKLRIDTRKFIAAKLLPKKYGDKVQLSGDEENPIVTKITGMIVK